MRSTVACLRPFMSVRAQEAHHNSTAAEYMSYKHCFLADIQMDHRDGEHAPMHLLHAPPPQ